VIANGEKGSLMPGFSRKSGGSLTDAQVDVLVRGMRSAWSKPGTPGGASMPAWRAQGAGDAGRGQAVYAAACARCHGATAQQPGPAGSILDGSFLALVNEQTLRTTVIAGRPDIGQPDWRNVVAGRALTDGEISDVAAWLIAQTPARPGHPYPNTRPTSERPGEQQPLAEKGTR
jgi:cytochrome c oxidase cbb3-type subunit 3/ubiquinol-cytochrome c reductase cytochrome c subunit